MPARDRKASLWVEAGRCPVEKFVVDVRIGAWTGGSWQGVVAGVGGGGCGVLVVARWWWLGGVRWWERGLRDKGCIHRLLLGTGREELLRTDKGRDTCGCAVQLHRMRCCMSLPGESAHVSHLLVARAQLVVLSHGLLKAGLVR